jgi:hypothetical protein
MQKNLWDYDKFWLIWVSCIDKPRTIKDIQNLWGYKGNSLYQQGRKDAIWVEMISEGFLERRGTIEKRGVTGLLLYANMDWIGKYLQIIAAKTKYKLKNPVPSEIIECFDKKRLIGFFNEKRVQFFLIDKIKLLFGEKENLREQYEMCIIAPMMVILDIFMLDTLSKEMGLHDDTYYIISQPIIFNPCFSVNFYEYFIAVSKDIKPKDIPEDLLIKEKIFQIWKEFTKRMFSGH